MGAVLNEVTALKTRVTASTERYGRRILFRRVHRHITTYFSSKLQCSCQEKTENTTDSFATCTFGYEPTKSVFKIASTPELAGRQVDQLLPKALKELQRSVTEVRRAPLRRLYQQVHEA